ncbi:MAG: hypothetical protein JXR91_11885 [Deltaproteobacteria bacterium]|nr:hypothetical protein [Deltaproteobacteria bacterium]
MSIKFKFIILPFLITLSSCDMMDDGVKKECLTQISYEGGGTDFTDFMSSDSYMDTASDMNTNMDTSETDSDNADSDYRDTGTMLILDDCYTAFGALISGDAVVDQMCSFPDTCGDSTKTISCIDGLLKSSDTAANDSDSMSK